MAATPADQEDKQPKIKATTKKTVAKSVTKSDVKASSVVPETVKPEGDTVVKSDVSKPEVTKPDLTKTDQPAVIGGMNGHDAKPKPSKRKLATRIGAGVIGLIVIVLAIFGVLIYGYRSDAAAVRYVSAVVPYPAMIVGGHPVSYHEYLFEMASIEKYYQSQASANGQTAIDFTSASGKKELATLRTQIISQLKTDSVTKQLIKDNKISVSDKELTTQFNQLVTSAGGKTQLDKVLKEVYGWDENDLKAKLKFQLASQKLQDKVTSDSKADAQAKAKATDIYNQIKAGGDFGELAKKYSEDSTASDGGDLSFFSKGQMVEAFEKVAFAQEPGQVSEPVKTEYGYHIIKTIEFNADKSQVHAAHILIKTIDFDTYLDDKVKAAKSTVLIKTS